MMESEWYYMKISGSVSSISNLHDGVRVVLREDLGRFLKLWLNQPRPNTKTLLFYIS